MSSSLDKLVETLVDNSHRTVKRLKYENVDYDDILINVNEIGEKDKSIKDLNKEYPDKI